MAKITEADFKLELKNETFGHLYLFYGEEKMLVKMYEQKLSAKLMGKEPSDFNYHKFNEESDIGDIINSMNIVPFTAPYNYVLVNDFPVEKIAEADYKVFLKSLEDIPDGTVVVIAMKTTLPTGKKANSWKRLIDTVSKNGTAVELNKKSIAELHRQVVAWANRRGNAITMENAGRIVEYVGTDLNLLKREVDKVCSYVDKGEILSEHIEKVITKNLSSRVYDMTDAIVQGNWEKAFKSLDLLFYQREEPIIILAEISATYTDMYRVRMAIESGLRYSDVADDFDYKRREFRLRKAERASARMSTEDISRCIDAIMYTNVKMNSTSTDKKLLLEKLISSLIMTGKGR